MDIEDRNITRDLARHLVEIELAKLDEGVVDAARLSLLDHLAAGSFAARMPWTRMVFDDAVRHSIAGDATIYGRNERLPAPMAARVNGTSGHGFELDDLYEPGLVHPGAVVIPAVLATTEVADMICGRALEGIVVGYEVLARTTAALGLWHNSHGFHATGTFGALGAAAAVARTRGVDVTTMEHALGVAASMSGGIKAFQTGGGMIKRLHAGRAAESGVTAVDLAGRGLTGPVDVYGVTRGLLDVYGGDTVDASKLIEGLGTSYAITETYFKPYASCAMTHTAIEATQSLMRQHALSPGEVAAVRVAACRRAVEQNSRLRVRDTMSAQYSIEYAVALALRLEADDPSCFLPEAVAEPDRLKLMELVDVVLDEAMEAAYPTHLGCTVTLETADGRDFEQTLLTSQQQSTPSGTKELVEHKARTLLGQVFGDERAEEIVMTVLGLSPDRPVSSLTALVRPADLNR